MRTNDSILNKSFEEFDRVFKKHLFTAEFSDELFLPLLAFIGRSFNKCYDTNWAMKYNTLFNTWIPDIKEENEFKKMYKPLLEILNPDSNNFYPIRSVFMTKDNFTPNRID